MTSKQRTLIALSLLASTALGVALGTFLARRCDVVSLATELDAEGAYFFAPQDESPIRGVLQPGAEIRVHMRKGGAVYVSVDTVLDRDAFERATAPR